MGTTKARCAGKDTKDTKTDSAAGDHSPGSDASVKRLEYTLGGGFDGGLQRRPLRAPPRHEHETGLRSNWSRARDGVTHEAAPQPVERVSAPRWKAIAIETAQSSEVENRT